MKLITDEVNNLKNIEWEKIKIFNNFKRLLNNSWYANNDFLLFIIMHGKVEFRDEIIEKCMLYKIN